jgi:hypothetical protein
MQTYIVLSKIRSNNNARSFSENIESMEIKFPNESKHLDEIILASRISKYITDRFDIMDILVYPISDYMDELNSMNIDMNSYYFSYVYLNFED